LVLVVHLVVCGRAWGKSGDDNLLLRANQMFAPLPKIMASEKNPVTPEKVRPRKIPEDVLQIPLLPSME
jgi:hypothetical protein